MGTSKLAFTDISKAAELEEYIEYNAFRHTNYYHYSSIEAIDGILSSEKL